MNRYEPEQLEEMRLIQIMWKSESVYIGGILKQNGITLNRLTSMDQ